MLLPSALLDTLLFLGAPGLVVAAPLLGALLMLVLVSPLLLSGALLLPVLVLGALLLLVIVLPLLLGAFLLVLSLSLLLLATLLLLVPVWLLPVRDGLSFRPAAPAVRRHEQRFREAKTELLW